MLTLKLQQPEKIAPRQQTFPSLSGIPMEFSGAFLARLFLNSGITPDNGLY